MTAPTKAAYSHLTPSARAAAALGLEQRIERLRRQRWIGYPRAASILELLESLITEPRKDRMTNVLITGRTNNGKTSIVKRFLRLHPEVEAPGAEGVRVPIVYLTVKSPDEDAFCHELLERLSPLERPSGRRAVLQGQVRHRLRSVGAQVLVLDDIHDILTGRILVQRDFLNKIRCLGTDLELNLVAVGTPEARRAVNADPQLANRFMPCELPPWEMGTVYLQLLASFEMMLPLREPSDLQEAGLAEKLLALSDGMIGELSQILTAAAIRALRTKRERIDEQLIDEIDWTPPDKRSLHSERSRD